MLGLDKPAVQLVKQMDSVQIPATVSQQTTPQEWVKRICKHRDLFSQVILCVADQQKKRFYYYLYACQNPQDVVVAPLQVGDSSLEAFSGSHCGAIDVPVLVHCSSFSLTVGSYISCRGLVLKDEEYLHVIPNVGFHMGNGQLMADSRNAVYYQDYLKGRPVPEAEKAGSSNARTKEQDDLLKLHPWMAKALDKKKPDPPPDLDKKPGEDDPTETLDVLPVDVVEAIMAKLVQKRPEMAALHQDTPRHFEVYLRREYESRGSGNTSADSARGQALASAQQFCTAHGVSMSGTYSFGTCGGEQGAHRLAQEWCRHMQALYDGFELAAGQCDWNQIISDIPVDQDFETWVASCAKAVVQLRALQIKNIMPH
jgi:hypothetical protein